MSDPSRVAVDRKPFANLTPSFKDAGNALVSVSTRFNPEENDIQGANVVILSLDHVQFYVHQDVLLLRSSNNFGSLLPDLVEGAAIGDVSQPTPPSDLFVLPIVIVVQYSADVLNVVLHIVYSFSVESYRPSPSTLRIATNVLFELGYTLEDIFAPHSEPYMLFLQAAVAEPLAMYALAAKYSLEPLAVAVSTFTLNASLSDISDELAHQMGPLYLRRLFFLHLGRSDALKRLLYPPPSPHPSSPDSDCDRRAQYEVSRIWALACASVVIENHPDNLVRVFAPLSAQLSCMGCRQTLQERVAALMNDWSSVKSTI